MTRRSAYIICTSPRSGSTLLCHMLAATGICGVPDSHIHAPSVDAWLEDHGLTAEAHDSAQQTLAAALQAAQDAGRGAGDIFGLRLQRHSAPFLLDALRSRHPGLPGDRAVIEAEFGPTRFIYLARASKLDQAISYVKACQSGLWHKAPDGREIERLSPPRAPLYDRKAIAEQIALFDTYEAEWRAWFAREAINPLCLDYDALSRDPAGTLARVLGHLGLPAAVASEIVPPVARLSDDINRAWAARYRAETGAD